jgi:hypothetical protein
VRRGRVWFDRAALEVGKASRPGPSTRCRRQRSGRHPSTPQRLEKKPVALQPSVDRHQSPSGHRHRRMVQLPDSVARHQVPGSVAPESRVRLQKKRVAPKGSQRMLRDVELFLSSAWTLLSVVPQVTVTSTVFLFSIEILFSLQQARASWPLGQSMTSSRNSRLINNTRMGVFAQEFL